MAALDAAMPSAPSTAPVGSMSTADAGDIAMDDQEAPRSAVEQSLGSLKSFMRMAWEDCRAPLTDAAGPAEVRWEIYSTWMLLLSIHHAEAECERCQASFQPRPWSTEAQGLRHVFLHNRSARILAAVLRWLRWAHRWGPAKLGAEEMDPDDGGDASYERTRRALQLKSGLPLPLQAAPALHPDGPLQQQDRFDVADLDDERRLLRRLFSHLRRGELSGALELCGAHGQAWRTALLQGMMPFADDTDELVGYDAMEGDDDEDLLAKIKEEHTDWTELGVLEGGAKSQGNPWRRLWKEQCWDVAQRNLKPGSQMDLSELAIYGFCAGHYDALFTYTGNTSWTDRCWVELHCLKEWLVERLLDIGREEWCQDEKLFLGEGDGGVPDTMETPEDRVIRGAKLCNKFAGASAEALEAMVAGEAKRLLTQLREDPSVPLRLRQEATSPFARLQATLIEAAWDPTTQHEVALGTLRNWLADGLDGTPCPFLVKQFASYFAIWAKDRAADQQQQIAMPEIATPAAFSQALDVDDIVRTLVGDLVSTASGSWVEQCLEGQAIELIAQHISALQVENRLDAFATFLVELGKHSSSIDGGSGDGTLRATVLERCVWVYWGSFPQEVFALLAVLVKRSLGTASGAVVQESLPDVGEIGVSTEASPASIVVSIHCLVAFWVVVRDKAGDECAMEEAFSGLERLFGITPQVDDSTTSDDLARMALEIVILPLLLDSLLCLSVKDVDSALKVLAMLQESQLWQDAFSSSGFRSEGLAELEWYLGLHQRGGASSQSQSDASIAREAMLDWARMRLTRDQALLEPIPGSNTSFAAEHWENMRRVLAYRVLEVLLTSYEQACDFDGAAHDLAVVVAQSPWMLRLVRPELLRSFLQRVALIPLRLDDLGAYYAESGSLPSSRAGAIVTN